MDMIFARRAGFVVVLAAVILVALHHFYNSRTPPIAASFPVPAATSARIVNVSPNCSGEWEIITVGPTPVPINEAGHCVVKAQIDVPLKFTDKEGKSIVVGPDGGNFGTFWPVTVQTVGSQPFTLHYRLVAN